MEVKHISSIFQRAVTWKRLHIGPWLPLKLNRKSQMLFQMPQLLSPGVTWRYLVLGPSDSSNRNGIYCAPWHSASSYYYRRSSSSSKGWSVKVGL